MGARFRSIRVLNVIDAYTRESLAMEVDTSFAVASHYAVKFEQDSVEVLSGGIRKRGHSPFCRDRMSAGWPVAARTLFQSIPSGSIFLRSVTARDIGTCVNW